MAQSPQKPSYVGAAFTHWLNLVFLTVGGVLGATVDPMFWVATAALDGAILWVVPDLPPFKAWVDKTQSAEAVAKERTYFLEQLWGLRPREFDSLAQKLASLLVSPTDPNVDDRVIRRGSQEFQHYLEMRGIVGKLKEMNRLSGVRLSESEINRLEQIINGFLRLLIATRPLNAALEKMDAEQLREEIGEIEERAREADPAVRAALMESLRLKKTQMERVPKLRATLELFKTRADALVYQLRNIHGQVLADPGLNVNSMLDEMVEQREMLTDPLSDLAADQMVRDFLGQAPSVSTTKDAQQRAAAAAKGQSAARRK